MKTIWCWLGLSALVSLGSGCVLEKTEGDRSGDDDIESEATASSAEGVTALEEEDVSLTSIWRASPPEGTRTRIAYWSGDGCHFVLTRVAVPSSAPPSFNVVLEKKDMPHQVCSGPNGYRILGERSWMTPPAGAVVGDANRHYVVVAFSQRLSPSGTARTATRMFQIGWRTGTLLREGLDMTIGVNGAPNPLPSNAPTAIAIDPFARTVILEGTGSFAGAQGPSSLGRWRGTYRNFLTRKPAASTVAQHALYF